MTLDFAFETKSVDEAAGTFEGFASVYSNTDHAGDVVEPGAFTRWLMSRGAEVPILWAHDHAQPVGLGVLTDSAAGLHVKAALDLDVTAGREAYSRVRKRIVRGLSIGYSVPKGGAENRAGVRHLKDIDLHEVSLTAVPANPEARITAVKSAVLTIRDFEGFLHQAGWSRTEAKRLAVNGWRGLESAGQDEADEAEVLAWLRAQGGKS